MSFLAIARASGQLADEIHDHVPDDEVALYIEP
jgi:hypothetical protein